MIDEAILAAMHKSFGNSIKRVFLPRFQRFFTFKEPNVGEQKTFSKIVLTNSESQSTVYGATMALIRKLSLDKDFSQFHLNEMERIIILANVFSTNFLTKQISVTCPNKDCNHQFVKNIKHGELLKNLEKIDSSDIVYEDDNDIGHIKVLINYPSVKKYLAFLEFIEDKDALSASFKDEASELDKYAQLDKAFDDMTSNSSNPLSPSNKEDNKIAGLIEKRKQNLKKMSSVKSKAAGNIDMGKINSQLVGLNSVDLYIRKIEWTVNGDATNYEVTFDDSISFEETEKILGGFPASFLQKSDGTSLTEYIAENLYKRVNATVPTITCPKCGLDITKDVNLYDFFIAG